MSNVQSSGQPLPDLNLRVMPARLTAGPLLLAVAVVAYAVWATTFALASNVDVSWLLVVCERLLGGERLHSDIVEVNPPFSPLLYMPYMLLEKLTGIAAELWVASGVVGLGLGSLLLSVLILSRGEAVYRRPGALWLAPAALFLVLCFLPNQFGQREHFALIGALPWIALQCARQRNPDFEAGSRPERILAGLGAAAVVMVKPPHFALALVLPSLWLALSRRSVKPLFVAENLVGATIVTAYVAYIAIFDPEFFTKVMPVVEEIYLPLRASLFDLMVNWPKVVLLLAAACTFAAGGWRRMHWDIKIPVLTALGFLPGFLVMGKGWPNHALPMAVVAIIAFGLALLRFGTFRDAVFMRRLALVFGCVLVLQVTVRAQHAALTTDSGWIDRSAAAIRGAVDRPTIISVASRLQAAHPLTRLVDGKFVARHPAAWAAYNAETLARNEADPERRRRLEALRDQTLADVAAEISARNPDVVLSGEDEWHAFTLRHPNMTAAMRDYEVLHADKEVTVFLRKDIRARMEAPVSISPPSSPAAASD